MSKCCNPFGTHDKKKKSSVKGNIKISLDLTKFLRANDIVVLPGWRLCCKCNNRAIEETNAESEHISSQEEWEWEPEVDQNQKLDTSIEALGVSPIKLKSLAKHRKQTVAKRKYEQIMDTVAKEISSVYDINKTSLSAESSCSSHLSTKEHDLDILIHQIKEKLKVTELYRQKIQLLTLVPDSWTRIKASNYFEVSEYLVRAAMKLKQENGILSLPSQKLGKVVSIDTVNLITQFYQND